MTIYGPIPIIIEAVTETVSYFDCINFAPLHLLPDARLYRPRR